MDLKFAEGVHQFLGGWPWQINETDWVAIGMCQDGRFIVYTDDAISEYDNDDASILYDFFQDTPLMGGSREQPRTLPEVTPSRVIHWNPALLAAQQPQATQVVISHIQYDGAVARVESDEYVEITNQGQASTDISGWQLHVEHTQRIFSFPLGTVLAAGQIIRVYTNQIHPETGGFSFGAARAVWNNQGDVGQLTDASGAVKSRYGYGNKALA